MTDSTPRRSNRSLRDEKEASPQRRGRSVSQIRMRLPPEERFSWGEHLESVLTSYSEHRGISSQQLVVLKGFLAGKNDKEIADECQCSVATIYEHWRRMAKKAGASLKSDVIADFHRFLSGR